MQSLLFYLRILSQNLAHISNNVLRIKKEESSIIFNRVEMQQNEENPQLMFTHIYLIDIQVTNGQVGFDTPMSFLTKISHNIYCELVIWNMYCFTIFTSYNCW